MEFKKFPSLENTYRQNLIDKVQYEGKDQGLWVASEKIHGANFSFWCDGNEVKVASRTQFVDGTFFSCQEVIDKYSQSILDWCRKNTITDFVVYGELFGKGIQKEVDYGEKDFAAFDVVIGGTVVEKDVAQVIAYECGLRFVPILKIGTFSECMKLSNTFKSLLSRIDHEGDNFAEGLVIEPLQPKWFDNGNRIYFKDKTEAFSEKKRVIKEKKVFELSEDESNLLNEILVYSTEQRVSNVLSKIGAITNKDFGKVLGLTVQDILEDFTKDTGKEPKSIVGENWKQFQKLLQAEVIPVIRKAFLLTIDN